MIKKMFQNEINKMHALQMVERKKAILLNLQLLAREKEGCQKRAGLDAAEMDEKLAERYCMEY